ncbi:hypothetical protein [Nocardia farcinica]|uniref:hypothetical protein n=1 Tax=Nocardia farcinica TaxID=37329 RepID=UPI002453DCD5|nr:hypothetical protein [Nocardia farcinica]
MPLEKAKILHIDEGVDFLGTSSAPHWRSRTGKRVVYIRPSEKALTSIVGKIRTLTPQESSNARDLAASAHPDAVRLVQLLLSQIDVGSKQVN